MLPRSLLAFSLTITLALHLSTIATAQDKAAKPAAESKASVTKTIALTIEFPGDVEVHYKAIAYTEGMTVFDALTAAAKHSRPLPFKHTGSGEFAFLTELDGVKNEGASGKNWIYKVDGQRAKVGMGSMKLMPGNQVVWIFGS
jgi:hypothetical protein